MTQRLYLMPFRDAVDSGAEGMLSALEADVLFVESLLSVPDEYSDREVILLFVTDELEGFSSSHIRILPKRELGETPERDEIPVPLSLSRFLVCPNLRMVAIRRASCSTTDRLRPAIVNLHNRTNYGNGTWTGPKVPRPSRLAQYLQKKRERFQEYALS